MICRVMMTVGLAALVAATPVSAEDKDERAPKEKKICRTEKVTGSLARKRRTCLTEKEWDELAARTKKELDDIGRGASGAPKCIGLNCDAAPGM